MAFAATSYSLLQYEDFINYWMKAYEQGTTTPKVMATDSSGVTTAAKFELNSQGFPVTAGSAKVIPFIDGSYDLWLFPTEAEADANDTTNAIQLADDIIAPSVAGSGSSSVNELTTATMTANTNKAYEVGDFIDVAEYSTGNGGAGRWQAVLASTVTENAIDIIAGVADPLVSFVLTNPAPTTSQLGVAADATINATIMQHSIDTYGFLAIDKDFEYDQTLTIKTVGAKIYSVGSNKDLTWSGDDAEWAIEAELDTGSYNNDFRNFRLVASEVTKQLFNAMWVRFSFFENFICTKGAVGMLHNACWNNLFIECHFINTFNTAGSIGVDFRHDAGETFNVSNDCKFVRCLFNTNEIGIRLEAGGDALNFDTCGIETNTWGVDITGIGNCHSVSFDYCYIEKNTSGNFRWNKTGSGNIFGLFIHKNYFGTESAARAGIIEFVGDNGATHNISIKDNSFRVFNGAPSTTFLLDVNGATMANIYIDWYNNNFADSGVIILPFDKTDVDWRYMSTDVGCQLDLQAPGVRTWTTDETLIVMVEAGTATLTGVFDSIDNVQTAAINVTDAMPIFLRPAQFTQQLCTSITDASTAATAVTCMINGGQLRTIGITDDTVRVLMTWRLSQNQRTTETDIS